MSFYRGMTSAERDGTAPHSSIKPTRNAEILVRMLGE